MGTKAPTRAPVAPPTPPVNEPLTGCAAHLSQGQCVNECEWKVGYPLSVPDMYAELSVESAWISLNGMFDLYNKYWVEAYASLVILLLCIAVRNLIENMICGALRSVHILYSLYLHFLNIAGSAIYKSYSVVRTWSCG